MVDPGFFPHAISPISDNALPRTTDAERERRIDEYRYLCRRAARRFIRSGVERSDLEQVAAIGLIKAADRYRPSDGTPFEAFAWTLVLGELMHFVRDHERLVRLPRTLVRIEKATASAHERLRSTLGREPSDGEIARDVGVDERLVREARAARDARNVRLDAGDLVDRARCERELSARVRGLETTDRLAISMALDELAPLALRVVLGLHVLGFKRAELAERLGLSTRRLARINERALAALARSIAVAA